jgi:hypothetical protein
MSKIKDFFKNLLVKNLLVEPSILEERQLFVRTNSAGLNWSTSTPTIYLLASGVTKREVLDCFPDHDVQKLKDNCFLVVLGAIDSQGNKCFFYENWFGDYSFERSGLCTASDWPPFKRHFIDTSTW